MGTVRKFRDLDAFIVAMTAVEATYQVTADFPDEEKFGLVSQMRRAAVSVPSNVAESQAVGSTRSSLRYVTIAIGSISELDTQVEIAVRLGFVNADRSQELGALVARVRQLLYGLRRAKQRQLTIKLASAPVLFLIAALLHHVW